MRYFKYYIGAAIVIILAAVIFWIRSSSGPTVLLKVEKPENASAKSAPIVTLEVKSKSSGSASASEPAQYCPKPEELIKDGLQWTTKDKKWENYTPSSATKILNFIGAQWVGIKVGKVICLYQANEAVSFPVALEQTRSRLVLEPRGVSWSALVGNRKFCKSASIVDCSYFFEPSKDVSNIYKEIEYAPSTDSDAGL